MKKLTEMKFNSEYPKVFVGNSNVFIADCGIFGKLEDGVFSKIIEFDKRFEIRNLSNIYFYLDEYSGEIGHLFSVYKDSFINVLDFSTYEMRLGMKNICLITNRQVPETLLFDIEKKHILWKQDKYFSFQIFDNELLVDNEKSGIVRYAFQTGLSLWHFLLPEGVYDGYNVHFKQVKKGEISKIIGVYDGVLWVALNTGWLLGLDVDNGTGRHRIRQPIEFDEMRIFVGLYTQLDTQKRVLFGLRNTHYWEIDLEKEVLSYQIYDISSSCQQFKIRAEMPIYDWIWLGNEIFFGEIYDADHRQDTNTVGIFDRTKREIIWADRIGKKGEIFPTIQKIDYAEQRLYVLDGECTLHVFERESTSV